MIAEDALIKYARGEGGEDDWNPALHPRTGMPPNPGWFAPTDGPQHKSRQDGSNPVEPRQRFAANEAGSRRSDAAPTSNSSVSLPPGEPNDERANFADRFGFGDQSAIFADRFGSKDEPANFADRFGDWPDKSDFWSKVWPAIRAWLREPVPEHDIDGGRVVGERPRWQAIAPYVGIPIATAGIFGLEAYAPAIAAWLGLGGEALAPVAPPILAPVASDTAGLSIAERVAQIHGVLDPIAQEMRTTAVLETNIGRIIAGGARDLAPAQRALIREGEIATQAPGIHAEITALQAATKLGAIPRQIAVSRAICPQCAAAIEAIGGKLTSLTTAIWRGP